MHPSDANRSDACAAQVEKTELDDAVAQVRASVNGANGGSSHQTESLQTSLRTIQQTVTDLYQKYNSLVARHQTLQANSADLRQLCDQAPWGLLVTDWKGQVIRANPAAAALLGTDRTSLVGRSLQDYIQVEQVSMVAQAIEQLRHGNTSCQVEIRLNTALEQPVYRQLIGRQLVESATAPREQSGIIWQMRNSTPDTQRELALQQQLEQAQLTNLVIQRIRQSLDPKEILDNTVSEILRVLQVDRVVIHSVNEQGTQAIAEALQIGYRSLRGSPIQPNVAQFPPEWHEADQPFVLEDVDALPSQTQIVKLLRCLQIRAMITVPIRREGELLGLLSVHQCEAVRTWLPFEITLLQQVAEQVAIALQHSRLYQQAQQENASLEEEVQRRTEQITWVLKYESMLKRITERVRDSLDQNQILQSAVKELTVVLGLAGCNAALYNFDENTSTILYEYSDSLPAFYGKVARMEDSPDIYRQLKLGHYFQFCSLYPNPVRGSVAMLACPIFVDPNSHEGMEQTVLGDLWLLREKDHVFNDYEIRLAQQVASQCAIAIRQARLYRAAQSQVEELARINDLKDQFLSTVSHELRTPIANLKMALHMMRLAEDPEKQQQYLQILDTELAREADLINDLLDLQRMEESSITIALTPLHLQSWLREQIAPFHSRMQTYQQTLTLHYPDDLPPLNTDASILQRILAELLNNACKYTPKEAAIDINIMPLPKPSHSAEPPSIVFTIRNQAEIPQTDLPNIFQKFYRVLQVDRYKHGGTGLGLALVEKLTEQLQGTICVESSNGWTQFTLTLPNPPLPQSSPSALPSPPETWTSAESTNTLD